MSIRSRTWVLCLAALGLSACQHVPLPPMGESAAEAARPVRDMNAKELKAEMSAGVRAPSAPVSMIEPLIEKRDEPSGTPGGKIGKAFTPACSKRLESSNAFT